MIHLLLPLLISSFVFVGTWSVSTYIRAHQDFAAQRHLHPKARPMLSRPIVCKR